MKIKVLGPGCMKCRKLYAETEKAIAEAGVSAELEKVEKIDEIVSYGVALTPALVIDGEVKSTGKALRQKEIVSLIAAAANKS
ncbi:MAG: thioredoxin family protein [Proteobacteria bacterium]|nr:thioredoxin family protein [Pseudomonadota bacterium]